MSFFRLLLANLFYHWRGNFAVFLGVVVGTAVLTGALLVGDSLRGSLRDITEKQLGWVEVALVNKRFFREELAEKLQAKTVAPALMLQVATTKKHEDITKRKRANKVVLLGVDPRFWSPNAKAEALKIGAMERKYWTPSDRVFVELKEQGVVLSAALATDLSAKVGDVLTVSFQKASAQPRETLLGRRGTKDVVSRLTLPVKAILAADHFGSRFSLNPGPSLPRNAFVPLGLLQDELRNQDRRSKTLPRRPINVMLAAGTDPAELGEKLKKHMQLDDWGLVQRKPRRRFGIPAPKYLSLESREMFVPPVVVQAVQKTNLRVAPTLVYLVNKIIAGDKFVPYAIVAALEPNLPPPLGPILPDDLERLGDDELLLVEWENSPLAKVEPGTKITLQYFDPQTEIKLEEKQTTFTLAKRVSINGARNDLHLTPDFPGITDSRTMAQLDGWDPPFPYHKEWVDDDDEQFWRDHRTTPKAYVTLATGQRLWGSRFGDVTSLRIDPAGKKPEQIEAEILKTLEPEQGGLVFQEVRRTKLQAGAEGLPFGMLFLGFSFFLIVAALLLIGLLFRLNIDRRASEIGLLLAVGNRLASVRWLLLAEGTLLALLGGAVGSVLAIWYAGWLLDYLGRSWPGGLDRSFLQVHITPFSLFTGFCAAVVVSVLTIFGTTFILGRLLPRALLGGVTTSSETLGDDRRPKWTLLVLGIGIVGALVCFVLGFFVSGHEAQAGSFMGSGFLLLVAGLALVWLWLKRRQESPVTEGGLLGLARLGMRNAGRHAVRSLLTMGLLASATFLIVAVQVFHRDPGELFLDKDGGSGGFPLLAETEVPVFQNLNSADARAEIDKANKKHQLPKDVTFHSFRVKTGDDASCLNLYKPREPRIMSVPDTIVKRGGFHFASTEAKTDDTKKNPWRLLEKPAKDGAIPVFGEMNTVTWMLRTGLGGTVQVTDDHGKQVTLRIVGLLRDSVFQSELLMSDANFRRLYPRREGFQFFLIDTPKEDMAITQTVLDNALPEYGLTVSKSSTRLEAFLAVENTYLATFQALGGLGLLLGVLGLAVVLLRSVWERRGELALMRALGFRRLSLGWLVLAENSYLLVLGLLVGTVAALLSVLPHLVSGSEVQWLPMLGFLLLVFVVGLTAGLLAIVSTLRAPLLPALRRE